MLDICALTLAHVKHLLFFFFNSSGLNFTYRMRECKWFESHVVEFKSKLLLACKTGVCLHGRRRLTFELYCIVSIRKRKKKKER